MLLQREYLTKLPDFFTEAFFRTSSRIAILMSMFGKKVVFWCALLSPPVTLSYAPGLWQTKRSTLEFTTVNKYLFVHFELNTLLSLLIFLFLFSVIVVCYTSNTTNCLLTNKLKVKVLVKKAHAVDSSFTYIHAQLHQLSHHNTTNMNCLKEIMLEIS